LPAQVQKNHFFSLFLKIASRETRKKLKQYKRLNYLSSDQIIDLATQPSVERLFFKQRNNLAAKFKFG
jgi:hypothetical protein